MPISYVTESRYLQFNGPKKASMSLGSKTIQLSCIGKLLLSSMKMEVKTEYSHNSNNPDKDGKNSMKWLVITCVDNRYGSKPWKE